MEYAALCTAWRAFALIMVVAADVCCFAWRFRAGMQKLTPTIRDSTPPQPRIDA
jgi:hypothetical protein